MSDLNLSKEKLKELEVEVIEEQNRECANEYELADEEEY